MNFDFSWFTNSDGATVWIRRSAVIAFIDDDDCRRIQLQDGSILDVKETAAAISEAFGVEKRVHDAG